MPKTASHLALLAAAALLAIALGDPAAAQETSKRDQLVQKTMDALDADRDGSISTAESETVQRARFKALDTNSDGALSSEEFKAYTPEFGKMPADEAKRTAWLEKRFKRLDTDDDGKVTEAEILTGGSKRFAAADDNKDGQVTAEELRRPKPATETQTQPQ